MILRPRGAQLPMNSTDSNMTSFLSLNIAHSINLAWATSFGLQCPADAFGKLEATNPSFQGFKSHRSIA